MKNNMKQIAEYRPLPEQKVVFIDKKTRPSDAGTLKMPQVNEVCEIRGVMKSVSLDTEEKGTGIYLNGYTNPMDEGSMEYCYEAERFVPQALAKMYCANYPTDQSAVVSPVPFNGPIIGSHMNLMKFFERKNFLCVIHPDGNGIDADVPARIGNLPMQVSYRHNKKVVTRCYSPIRIQPRHKAQINELVRQLNEQREIPRYGIETHSNLAYSTLSVNPVEMERRGGLAASLVEFSTFLTTRLLDAMMKVMYGGLSPAEALAALDNKKAGKKDVSTGDGLIIGLQEFSGAKKLTNSQLKRN